MILKAENPQAKDHRPITLLNTMYKTITPLIDSKVKDHQDKRQYMQIDQRGCTTGSIGSTDNLITDKATLDGASDRNNNLRCTWIDVKKALYSINHEGLALSLEMHKESKEDSKLHEKYNGKMVHHIRGHDQGQVRELAQSN